MRSKRAAWAVRRAEKLGKAHDERAAQRLRKKRCKSTLALSVSVALLLSIGIKNFARRLSSEPSRVRVPRSERPSAPSHAYHRSIRLYGLPM